MISLVSIARSVTSLSFQIYLNRPASSAMTATRLRVSGFGAQRRTQASKQEESLRPERSYPLLLRLPSYTPTSTVKDTPSSSTSWPMAVDGSNDFTNPQKPDMPALTRGWFNDHNSSGHRTFTTAVPCALLLQRCALTLILKLHRSRAAEVVGGGYTARPEYTARPIDVSTFGMMSTTQTHNFISLERQKPYGRLLVILFLSYLFEKICIC